MPADQRSKNPFRRWYRDQPVTIRAAILGGIFALIAATLAIVFEIIRPPQIVVFVPPTGTIQVSPIVSKTPDTFTRTNGPAVTATLAQIPTYPVIASPTRITPKNASMPTPTATPTNTPTKTPTPTPKWVTLRSFPAPRAGPAGLVRVEDNVWVSIPGDGRLYRLDIEGNFDAEFALPANCSPETRGGHDCRGSLAWDGNWLWFATRNSVYQLDPQTGQKLGTFEVDLDVIVGIVWDGQGLLMIDRVGNLVRYDRTGQRLRQFAVKRPHGEVTGMAWVDGELWVVGSFGYLSRFDSGFGSVSSFDSFDLGLCTEASFPYYLALFWDGNSLWVADFDSARVSQCGHID